MPDGDQCQSPVWPQQQHRPLPRSTALVNCSSGMVPQSDQAQPFYTPSSSAGTWNDCCLDSQPHRPSLSNAPRSHLGAAAPLQSVHPAFGTHQNRTAEQGSVVHSSSPPITARPYPPAQQWGPSGNPFLVNSGDPPLTSSATVLSSGTPQPTWQQPPLPGALTGHSLPVASQQRAPPAFQQRQTGSPASSSCPINHPCYAHLDLSRPLCLQQPTAFAQCALGQRSDSPLQQHQHHSATGPLPASCGFGVCPAASCLQLPATVDDAHVRRRSAVGTCTSVLLPHSLQHHQQQQRFLPQQEQQQQQEPLHLQQQPSGHYAARSAGNGPQTGCPVSIQHPLHRQRQQQPYTFVGETVHADQMQRAPYHRQLAAHQAVQQQEEAQEEDWGASAQQPQQQSFVDDGDAFHTAAAGTGNWLFALFAFVTSDADGSCGPKGVLHDAK